MADQVDVSGGPPGPARRGQSLWVYWAPFFLAADALLLGIPVCLAQRRHMGQPEAVPPYR